MNKSRPANDTILKAALGEPVERVPVWIMRQAGRYLPEFRELRAKYGFFEICDNPELASEATIYPLKRFDIDALVIFSDILTIPTAIGFPFDMIKGKGPVCQNPITSIQQLKQDFIHTGSYKKHFLPLYAAITLTISKIDNQLPILGFCGAPWTLFYYMVDNPKVNARKFLYIDETIIQQFFHQLATVCIEMLVGQVKAGASMLQIFESHAGELSTHNFLKFSMPYLNRIQKEVYENLVLLDIKPVPMIVFAKGAHHSIQALTESKFNVISVDYMTSPDKVKKFAVDKYTLQGNLDPCALFDTQKTMEYYAKKQLDAFGTTNYISNLGHGILPETPIENVKSYIDAIHEISKQRIIKHKKT